MKNKIFYHGTDHENKAQGILSEGICPDLSETEGLARPVEGRIYMTTNLKDALAYLLGGAMCGSELPPEWILQSQYGYMFMINGEDLDDVQPDEDQVGEAMYKQNFPWIHKYIPKLQEQEALNDDDSDDNEHINFYHNLWDQVKDGEYSAWIKAGHLLLPVLNDSEKHDIMSEFGNVAHLGKVMPKAAWKFDKNKSSQLKEDGSNFFDLAEKVL